LGRGGYRETFKNNLGGLIYGLAEAEVIGDSSIPNREKEKREKGKGRVLDRSHSFALFTNRRGERPEMNCS